jgi:hypothetical protein
MYIAAFSARGIEARFRIAGQPLRPVRNMPGVVAVTTMVALGCIRPERTENVNVRIPDLLTERHRADALRRFDTAVLFKPLTDGAPSLEMVLAPLIVFEIGNRESDGDAARFGTVFRDADDRLKVDPTARVVYAATTSTRITGEPFPFGGRTESDSVSVAEPVNGGGTEADTDEANGTGATHDVVSFVWFHASSEPAADPGGLLAHILQIVLDQDGYPMIWTAAGPAPLATVAFAHSRRVFVAESLEKAACAAFGGPLPGRRFCVEGDQTLAPYSSVSGVIPQGPIPMGPYVYLSAAEFEPVAVLCRCSPSQVEHFSSEDHYELRALAELDGQPSQAGRANGSARGSPERFVEDLSPWRSLRLPRSETNP